VTTATQYQDSLAELIARHTTSKFQVIYQPWGWDELMHHGRLVCSYRVVLLVGIPVTEIIEAGTVESTTLIYPYSGSYIAKLIDGGEVA
jgi:hypothetical protein